MRPTTLDLPARHLKPCFDELARLLTLKGENTFKIRAFENGATILDATPLSLGEFMQTAAQGEVKGFGKGLQEILTQLADRGSCDALDELRREFPSTLLKLLELPGLGPKKLATLREQLAINDIATLESACQRGEIAELKGFGAKTQAKFLEAITELRSYEGLFRLNIALADSEKAQEALQRLPGIKATFPIGALRRIAETFSEIEFLVTTDDTELELPSIFANCSLPIKLRQIEAEQLGVQLLISTGSNAHLQELERHIRSNGLTSLQNSDGTINRHWLGLSEEEIFTQLRLAFIPPELREGRGEIATAADYFAKHAQFPKLVTLQDLKGVLHAHSSYSDGRNSLSEMAQGALDRGYQYFGISDHSQSSFYAGGLAPERVKKQAVEVEELNGKLQPFKIFRGTEADILPDGTLDYGDLFLSKLDFVVVSVHSSFQQSKEEMTNRVVRAVRNPATTILGHPTGRLLLDRKAYQIDLIQVLQAAAEAGTVVEINCNPLRLELAWELLSYAKELGVKIAINPDAHSVAQIDYLRFGVLIARKGGLTPDDILNCLTRDQFSHYLQERRADYAS